MWNDGNAYDGNNFHIYRVESISKPMPEQRNINDLYKENSMVSKKVKVFRIFLGKKTYNVRIRVRNELAGSDIDEFWKDVMMVPIDEGNFTINVPVAVSRTFYAWISTFDRRAKILSPDPVVAEMCKFLENALDMYKDEGWC